MEPIEQDAETYRPVVSLVHWPLGAAWLLALGMLVMDARGRYA
jgi:hypothetical protein